MNFLSHAHLSGNDDSLLFGNFIADGIKGNKINGFDKNVRAGIALHRKIDTFTDKHPVVKHSKSVIRSKYGLYSGIVIDIYYDHFLSANWDEYHDTDLADFSQFVYKTIAKRFYLLPQKMLRILPFMIAQNWLTSYANPNDLKRVFYGMDRRTGFKSGMKTAVDDLLDNYKILENDFREFYPLLTAYVKEEIRHLEMTIN